MEINGKVHCFFEQSGTFKNEFIKLGYIAEDYDIQNNFGQTDNVIDLFAEIEKGYNGQPSIFDQIRGGQNDLIVAFFPCIYFCENNVLYFTGKHANLNKHKMYDKIKEIIKRDDNRHYFYCLLLKMLYICELLNIRLIIENPYSTEHYLYNNFPYSPTIIDKDRTRRGDYYKKPTQFIFCNCTPTNGISFTKPLIHKNVRSGKPGIKGGICSEDRSLISTDYARNFICDFIIGKEQTNTIPQLKFAD